MKIEVYSDGSSDGKSGGLCGWGFVVIVDGVKTHEGSGSEPNGSNNVGEVLAATKGLEYVVATYPACQDVTLISDSQITLRWATGEYQVKKWHLVPYVLALRKAFNQLKVTARWVKGHNGNPNNERCDKLAKAARESLDREDPSVEDDDTAVALPSD